MKYRFLVLLFFMLSFFSCKDSKINHGNTKIYVITTLFPLYDFAKTIGQDKIQVQLLLPPGVEAHSFEPKPEDIIKISNSKVFVYMGKDMERWAEKIIKSIDSNKVIVVEASKGTKVYHDGHNYKHRLNHKYSVADPHVWLDFDNVKIIVDNILTGLVLADGTNRDFYTKNAEVLKETLTELDQEFKKGLSHCKKRHFFHAGHFAFGYLAKRYNLIYYSAYAGMWADEEPTANRIDEMIREIKKHNVKYVFFEELISPRIGEVLSKEAGVTLLKLNPAHNLIKEDLERGVTFVDIMKYNLNQLRIGLECQ